MKLTSRKIDVVSIQFFQQVHLNDVGLVFREGCVFGQATNSFRFGATEASFDQFVELADDRCTNRTRFEVVLEEFVKLNSNVIWKRELANRQDFANVLRRVGQRVLQ